MMYYNYGNFLPFHTFGFIFMFLFWFLVIYGLVSLFKKADSTHGIENSSIEILKSRYAKGEINKEQFEEMKKVLK